MYASKYLKKLIASNETDKAIKKIEEVADQTDGELQDQIVLLAGNYARLISDKEKGVLSKSDEQLYLSRINNALLDIIAELPPELKISIDKGEKRRIDFKSFLYRKTYTILVSLWSALILIAVVVGMVSKNGIQAKLDLSLNKVDFVTRGNNNLDIGEFLTSIEIGYFDELRIPALSLELTEHFESTKPPLYFDDIEKSEFSIKSESKGSLIPSFICDSIFLQSINFSHGTRVMLTLPEEIDPANSYINMDFKKGKIEAELKFSSALNFEVNNSILEGLNDEEVLELSWAQGLVKIQEGDVLSFKLKGANNLFMTLLSNGSLGHTIKKQNIFVDSIRLEREPGGTTRNTISSIIDGNIQFLDRKDIPYHAIELSKPDFLQLLNYNTLEITSLNLNTDQLMIQLIGKIGKVYKGASKDNMYLQNPSLLKWLWYNHLLWVVFIPVLVIFMTITMLTYLKRKL